MDDGLSYIKCQDLSNWELTTWGSPCSTCCGEVTFLTFSLDLRENKNSVTSISPNSSFGENLGSPWTSLYIGRVVPTMVLCASWTKIGNIGCIIITVRVNSMFIQTNVWITYHVVLRVGAQCVWQENITTDSAKSPENCGCFIDAVFGERAGEGPFSV